MSINYLTPMLQKVPVKKTENLIFGRQKAKKMATALLSTTCFLPSQNKEGNGLNLKSSFSGKVILNRSFLKREISRMHGNRFVIASVVQKRETVIPDPDYRIPVVLLGFAGGLAYTNNVLLAAPVDLLGLLILFQTTRVRFVFYDEALEVKVGDQLEDSGENVFVGGKNHWKY